MNKKMINKLMNTLLMISSLAILVGVIFQVQHYPFGHSILMTGLITYFFISGIEIKRLKKVIAESSK